jgi:hypothetical protein
MADMKEPAAATPLPNQTLPEKPTTQDCGCGSTVEVPTTDTLPTDADISKASDLKVFDASGKEYTFKTVAQPDDAEKNLVIFIRHFFCGVRHYTMPSS